MRHRRSRTHVRHHRERIIGKRRAEARRIFVGDWELWLTERPLGELVNEQAWLGCRRAHCGLCRPHKRWPNAERQRAEENWRREWNA